MMYCLLEHYQWFLVSLYLDNQSDTGENEMSWYIHICRLNEIKRKLKEKSKPKLVD